MAAPLSSESDKLDEARFRARMARVSESGAYPGRPRPREDEEEAATGRFRLGWFGWLLVDGLVVIGTVAAVVAWPPVDACRTQGRTVGFMTGETVEKCIRRGIGERLSNADQRVKMLLRGSGH
ncbi:MAG: hypothetical protein ABW058_09605 [Methylobacterium sp.]